MWEQLRTILPFVEKPARYIGNEINAVVKEATAVELRFALAFPDVYEIGSSYMGFQVLYAILNELPWVQAERVFAPWPDMEAKMRQQQIPLYGLETKTALADFDVIGFTLQYELGFTNILNMLDLAGISPLAGERNGLPLIIAGGPGALNPEPLSDFIDAFVLGEGEESSVEIAQAVRAAKARNWGKERTLKALAAIPGLYLPKFYRPLYAGGRYLGIEPGVLPLPKKRILSDFARFPLPKKLPVPFVQPVHDRVSIEICRGCARGCRFCQAGMLYRPVRERPVADLVTQGKALLASTGAAEISLSSLSSADYSEIEPLVRALLSDDISVSLPSLRVDTYSVALAELTKSRRKTGLTLAPEAGSQRLRDVINKNVEDADIVAAAGAAFSSGWDSLKLYFMIGLPSETDADVAGIADLAWRLARLHRDIRGKKQRLRMTVAISTFVPKAHTPFQWSAFLARDQVKKRQRLLLDKLRPPLFKVQTMDWAESRLEALLARGGRLIGPAILRAWQLGCRFDAWTEHFRPQLWEQAFAETGVDVAGALAEIPLTAALPWDHIDIGVSKQYLLAELERAQKGETTADCSLAGCTDCGVCASFALAPIKRGGQ